MTSPFYIRSSASQPPSYTQLFRAEEGGEGVAAGGGAGSVSSLGSPPPYTSGGTRSLCRHLHIIVCIFQWTLELTEWAYEPELITWNFEKEITSNNTGFQMHVGDIHQT